jgi:hypothetical protein
MKTKRRSPHWTATVVIALAAYFFQCGHDDGPDGLPPVIYQGTASDEALERFWDKLPGATESLASAAMITSPANGAELSVDPPPTITWQIPASSNGPDPRLRGFAKLASVEDPAWFGLAIARAHLPPVTGHVFLLELRTSAEEVDPLRVFTTELFWPIAADAWATLKATKRPVTVRLWNAYLNQNVVEEGPYTRPEATIFNIAVP